MSHCAPVADRCVTRWLLLQHEPRTQRKVIQSPTHGATTALADAAVSDANRSGSADAAKAARTPTGPRMRSCSERARTVSLRVFAVVNDWKQNGFTLRLTQ